MKKLIVALASAVLVTIAANAALALVGMGDPVILQPDKDCGYAMKPSQDHFRFLVHTRINSKSMRSSELDERKVAGTVRLLFVGDSITYGTTRVDQNDIFTEVLNRQLPNIIHQKVQTLNASASAWAIRNELGYVRSRGTFQADIVVLVLNDGDLSQPFARPEDVGSQLLFTKPLCALCELIGHFTNYQRADKGTTQKEDSEQAQANLRDLSAFKTVVLGEGSRMIILFVPFRRDIKRPGQKVLQPQLLGWASANSVPLIDATSYLERLSISDASIDGGTHLSVKGNAAVAQAFERFAATQIAKNPTAL